MFWKNVNTLKKKKIRYITVDLEMSSDDSDKENIGKKDLKKMLTMMYFVGEKFLYNYF